MSTVDAMKTLKEIKTQLETLKPLLSERYGVETIGVFGSYTRGEQNKKSDIDVLVSRKDNMGFREYMDLREALGDMFGRKIDLVTDASVHRLLRDRIFGEARPI